MKSALAGLGLSIALLASPPAFSANILVNSGFLPDYSKLEAVANRQGVRRYLDKSVDLRPYTKLYIEPVQILISTDGDYKGVQPDVLKRMSDSFKTAFVRAATPAYEIVTAPAPDALTVRLAITGIQATRPPRDASDILPIKIFFNVGAAASGNAPRAAEISAEMEILDGRGKQAVAAVATRMANQNLAQNEQITWMNLSPMVEAWARNFRVGLDEARGVTTAAK